MPITIGGNQTPVQTRTTDIFAKYPELGRISRRQYDPTKAWANISKTKQGTLTGGPTYEHLTALTYDPMKYTVIAPSRRLDEPIFAKQGRNRTGSWTLDLVDLPGSLSELTGSTINKTPPIAGSGGTFDPVMFLASKGINFENVPVRLMDYAFAPLTLLGIGIGKDVSVPAEDMQFAFQQRPEYWAWLSSSSPTARKLLARSIADPFVTGGRNAYLTDAVAQQLERDFLSKTYRSSGNPRNDYLAKKTLEKAIEMERAGVIVRTPQGTTLGSGPESLAFPIVVGAQAGRTMFTAIPWGTEVFNALDPISPEVERIWNTLAPEQRRDLLGTQALPMLIADLGVGVYAFSKFDSLIRLGATGGFGSLATRLGYGMGAAQRAQQVGSIATTGYYRSLVALNALMGTGAAVALTNWSLSAASPAWSKSIGQTIDSGRLISQSEIAGIANVWGYFGGFYGVDWLAPRVVRNAASWTRLARNPANYMNRQVSSLKPLAYDLEHGGSKAAKTLEEYGITREEQGTVLGSQMLSEYLNLTADNVATWFGEIKKGASTGVAAIDRMASTPAERIAIAEAILHNGVRDVRIADIEIIGKTFQARNLDPSLAKGGWRDREAIRVMQKMAQHIDDQATRRMLKSMGDDRFPGDVAGNQALTTKYLRALGSEGDLTPATTYAGKDVRKWVQLNRRLHAVLYHRRVAELDAVSSLPDEMGKVADEAGRVGLFSLRSLTRNDVSEFVPLLRHEDPAVGTDAATRLMQEKTEVAAWRARGLWQTPEQLSDLLEKANPTLPVRRTASATAEDLPLNNFVRMLDGEGIWYVGYKPTAEVNPTWITWVKGTEPPPPPPDFDLPTYEFAATTPEDLFAQGYVRMQAGDIFSGRLWAKMKPVMLRPEVGGGWFYKPLPSMQPVAAPAPTAGTAAPTVGAARTAMAQGAPPPVNAAWLTDHTWSFATKPDEFDLSPVLTDVGTVKYVSGRNYGADWPILTDAQGRKWIFKSNREGSLAIDPTPDHFTDHLLSQSDTRNLGGPTATRMFEYLGLRTALEVPYTFRGIKGTLQEFVDVAEAVDINNLDRLVTLSNQQPEVWEDILRQNVVDWFTSQHDTNSDALVILQDGTLAGIDKGQAFKFIKDADENAAAYGGMDWWDYRWQGSSDQHLSQAIRDVAQQRGVIPNRGVVEDLIARIEAIPDEVIEEWIRPLAEAREARFGEPATALIDQMIARRDHIRWAVNDAYEQLGGIGLLPDRLKQQSLKTGGIGTFKAGSDWRPVNGYRVYPEAGSGMYDPDPANIDAIGLVIREADGRIWRYTTDDGSSLPWLPGVGHTGFAQDLRVSAVHYAADRLGMDVKIVEHLVDDSGTRWFVAERIGGGPQFADLGYAKTMVLAPHNEFTEMVFYQIDPTTAQVFNNPGGHYEILHDHYDSFVFNEQSSTAFSTTPSPPPAPAVAGVAQAAPEPPIPTMPDPAPPDNVIGSGPGDPITVDPTGDFVSYVDLPDGSVFRSPWLEYPLHNVNQVELGNRSFMHQKLDSLFMGWRSWRITEAQKAGMWRRVSSLSPEFTPAAVNRFHEELLEMAAHEHVPPQGLGTMPRFAVPGVSRFHAQVQELGESIFGKGPYLGRNGSMIEIDWANEVARAYRTSLTMNATAGVTSNLYRLGGPGHIAGYVARAIYPAWRFVFSPLFKAGEYVESWSLNALRGVNPFGGDTFADALLLRGGLGVQHHLLREESMTDPMIMRAGDPTARDARYREHWWSMRTPQQVDQIGEPTAPRPEPGPLDKMLFAEVDESIYPAEYGASVPESMLAVQRIDQDGTPVLTRDARQNDELLLSRASRMGYLWEELAQQAVVTGTPAVGAFASRLSAIHKHLGADFVRRLAESSGVVHAATSSSGFSNVLRSLEDRLSAGESPFGIVNYQRGQVQAQSSGLVLEGQPQIQLSGTQRQNTGEGEYNWGFGIGTYASFGAGNMSSYGGGGWTDPARSMFVVTRPEALKDAWITLDDRMSLLHSYGGPYTGEVRGSNTMSPWGMQKLVQSHMLAKLVGEDKIKVNSIFEEFNTMSPTEIGWTRPLDWADVDVIFVQESNLAATIDLLDSYRSTVPELANVQVRSFPDGTGGRPEVEAYFFEKAGLMDKYGLEIDIATDTTPGDYLTLPDDLPDGVMAKLWPELKDALPKAGVDARIEYSLADIVRRRIADTLEKAELKRGELTTREHQASSISEVERLALEETGYRNEVADLEMMLGDLEAHLAARPPEGTPEFAAWDRWLDDFGSQHAYQSRGLNVTREPVSQLVISGAGGEEVLRKALPMPRVPDMANRLAISGSAQVSRQLDIEAARETLAWLKTADGRKSLGQGTMEMGGSPWANDSAMVAELQEALAPTEFLDELWRAGKASTGKPGLERPNVQIYFRGSPKAFRHQEGGEFVVVATGVDGTPYAGMLPGEIEAIWRRMGTPKYLNDRALGGGDFNTNTNVVLLEDGSFYIKNPWESWSGLSFADDPQTGYVAFSAPGGRPTQSTRYAHSVVFEPVFANNGLGHTRLDGAGDAWFPHKAETIGAVTDGGGMEVYGSQLHDPWNYRVTMTPSGNGKVIEVRGSPDTVLAYEMIDDMIARFGDDAVRLDYFLSSYREKPDPILAALASRAATGRHPANWTIIRRDGYGGSQTVNLDDYMVSIGLHGNPAAQALREAEEAAAIAPTTGEAMVDEMVRLTKTDRVKAKFREGAEAVANPVPHKEYQQQKLAFKLMQEYLPGVMKQMAPVQYKLFREELLVPDDKIAAFVLRDRELLERWLRTGDAKDLDALIAHADTYTHGAAGAAPRQQLDNLYGTEEFQTIAELMRLTMKVAHQEAYQVHFFSLYRGTFERSINHPVLGVYPASWAYKVAKEWFRFLYQNGTFRYLKLGMTPAQVIGRLARDQATFAAQQGEELDEWYRNGPLSSSIFIFNLLLPGDWSALPFPLSRSIRDLLRGNYDPASHLENNLSGIGLTRDIRLGAESYDELTTLLFNGNEMPKYRENERYVEPAEVFRR